MEPWLLNMLTAAVAAGPSAETSFSTFLQHLHNEMAAGTGTSNPSSVTAALLADADAVIQALLHGTAPAQPASDPAPAEEPTPEASTEPQPADPVEAPAAEPDPAPVDPAPTEPSADPAPAPPTL